jgi:uncharacterized protein with PQ loop repeat
MELTAVVTLLTTVVSVGVKVVGFPDQIKSNFRRKSTSGLSTWFVMSAFISYILWTIHGLQVHDEALIIGQGLGVATTGVIVWQIAIYNKNSKKTKVESKYMLSLLSYRTIRRVAKMPTLFQRISRL